MPNNAFFRLFHLQKNVSETVFTNVSADAYPARLTEDYTNYFDHYAEKKRYRADHIYNGYLTFYFSLNALGVKPHFDLKTVEK